MGLMHRSQAAILAFAALSALAGAASAADRWFEFRSGPFEVFTNAGERAGRGVLMRVEQLRHALGQIVGENDLQTPLPVRVLVFRKQDGRAPGNAVTTGRDRFYIVQTAETPPTPALQRDLVRLLLESNTARMPATWERGVEELFSTLDVTGIKITLGKPPATRSRNWARVHLLATSPEYYGKLRVILYNLRRGVPAEAAYRNAVAKSPAEIEAELDRYIAAGNFPTVGVSPRALAEADFRERPVEPDAARLALADMLGPDARPAYQAMLRDKINVPECHEGLGVLALREGRPADAQREFAASMAAGSRSARCYVEYGRLEPDMGLATAALHKAVALNPKLAEPHFLLAQREITPEKRIAELKTATALDPRQLSYWKALAETYLKQGDFANAAKAWTAAEQAAPDEASRSAMRANRAAIEQQRLDYQAAERKRADEEKRVELERLKAEARAEVRAAEARINRGEPAAPAGKVVPWWDGPKPQGRARGTLKQVDCLGRQVRIVIAGDDGKLIRLLIPDASQVTVLGGGEQALGCGPQKPRRVSVEYFPISNPKLATSGEVATIEFQ